MVEKQKISLQDTKDSEKVPTESQGIIFKEKCGYMIRKRDNQSIVERIQSQSEKLVQNKSVEQDRKVGRTGQSSSPLVAPA